MRREFLHFGFAGQPLENLQDGLRGYPLRQDPTPFDTGREDQGYDYAALTSG
jgi:hypothetical protein